MDFNQKALIVIEHVARYVDPVNVDEGLELIYKAAHCVNGECGKIHPGWREEVLAFYDSLVREGKYDPNGRKANLN